MAVNAVQLDCRFCSIVSRTNGEDPIGSDHLHDHWFIAEILQPWLNNIWTEHPIVAAVYELVKTLRHDHNIRVRPLMLAPDSGADRFANRYYYHPKQTPVLYGCVASAPSEARLFVS